MERKEWFRDHLIDWVKEKRNFSFDSLSHQDRSKEMTRYYVKEVVSKLTPGLIPDDLDDIEDYVVDGPNDGGVDFIFRSEGYVLIIQSKYHAKGKLEDHKEVSSSVKCFSASMRLRAERENTIVSSRKCCQKLTGKQIILIFGFARWDENQSQSKLDLRQVLYWFPSLKIWLIVLISRF